MAGTYWLTILPETSRLESGIIAATNRASRGAVISPRYDTSGAGKAGQNAGREIRGGVEGEVNKGGNLGRLLRIDGANATGARAGQDINAGLQSANVGRGLDASVAQNMSGGEAIGRSFGSRLATGLKATAAVGAGVVIAGIGGALKSGFSRLTAIDDASFKLQGLGNSAEKVKSIMTDAQKSVKGTAFGLDEAATTAATAVAAGIAPGQALEKYLRTTADAAGVAGVSMGEMGQIFNNVQTSGKAFTGELNQLASRGLPIFTWLQNEYGVTGEELSKMVSDGKVDSATFQKVIAENIGGAALTMGNSITGSLKNARASYSRFGAALAGPLLAGMVPFIGAFTSVFDDVTIAIKPIMENLKTMITPWATGIAASITDWAKNGGVQSIISWFGQLQDKIAALTSGGGGDTLSTITEGAKGLGTALSSAAPALQNIGTALGAFGQAIIQAGPDTISAIMVPAINIMAGALRFLADNASWAVPLIVALGGAFLLMRSSAAVLAPLFNAWSAVTSAFRTPLVIAQTLAVRQQAAAMTQLSMALGTNTVAQNMNIASGNAAAATTMRGRAAAIGHAIATRAQAVATRAAAMGQWLLNAALTANPIGLIIAGLVAIGVALYAFFTRTETGRKMWSAIWGAMKTAAAAVWDWMKGAIQVLGAVVTWLWQNIAVPAFNGIKAALEVMWAGTKVIWDLLTAAIQWVGDKVSWLWQNIAQPAFEGIGTALSSMWQGAQVIWDTFMTVIDKVGEKVGAFKDGLVAAFETVRDVVVKVWDKIGGIIDSIGNGVGKVGDFLSGAGSVIVNTLGLGDGYATGGAIAGAGGPTDDRIPAMLSNGEHVLTAADVAAMGGQGGVYAFRNALHRAVGGPVSQAQIPRIPGEDFGKIGPEAGNRKDRNPGSGYPGVIGMPDWGIPGTKFGDAPFDWWDKPINPDDVLFPDWMPPGLRDWWMDKWGGGSMKPLGFADGGAIDLPIGKAGESNLQGNSVLVSRLISHMFPQIKEIGGYRANGGVSPDHPNGVALDFMVPNYQSNEGIALGDTLTTFLMKNAEALGVEYTIWRQTYRNASGSSNVMNDAGNDNDNHMNHVHVSTKPAPLRKNYKAPAGLSLPANLTNGSGLDGQGVTSIGGATSASGGGSYRAATDSELTSSSNKVNSTSKAVTQAEQSVDDKTYSRDRKKQRLDELRAAGKDTTDAQRAYDVSIRELNDATDRLAEARAKAGDAEAADTELRTKGKLDTKGTGSSSGKGSGGSEGSDFGKMFVSGLLESVGLDGSIFSNPLEWPTVKSAMAGVNFLGGLMSGGSEDAAAASPGGFAAGAADSVGLGGLLSTIPSASSVMDLQSGSPALAPGQVNPAVPGASSPSGGPGMSAFAPAAHTGAGGAPGPVDNSININGNVGMAPTDVMNTVRSEQNARTRTTKVT